MLLMRISHKTERERKQTYLWLSFLIHPLTLHKDHDVMFSQLSEDTIGDGYNLDTADPETCFFTGLAFSTSEEGLAVFEVATRKLPCPCNCVSSRSCEYKTPGSLGSGKQDGMYIPEP